MFEPKSENGFSITQKMIRNSTLSSSSLLVAIIIADRYDQNRGYSKVPLSYIIDATSFSRGTVVKAIAEIVDSGEWKAVKRNGLPTKYYPVIDRLNSMRERSKSESNYSSLDVPEQDTDEETSHEPTAENSQKRQSNSKQELPTATKIATSTGVAYPKTSENTDPFLDGLPLSDYNSENPLHIPLVTNPPVLNTTLGMAIRLHRRTDIATRFKKHEFTVEKIKEMMDILHHQNNPLEAIDIAFWIQCRDSQPLNTTFISLALSRCVRDGKIHAPKTHDATKEDPAQELAKEIYAVYKSRHVLNNQKAIIHEPEESRYAETF